MCKQDRQGVRTPSALEQKYAFGKSFAEVFGIATDAQKTAEEAKEAFEGLDSTEIFNLLTDNGRIQGVYKGGDGNIYINATYIKTGCITISKTMFVEPGIPEVEKILRHLSETEIIPTEQIPLYDFDGNGRITVYDSLLAAQANAGEISLADWSGAVTSEIVFSIDLESLKDTIKFTGKNMWGRDIGGAIGFDSAFLKASGTNVYQNVNGEIEYINPPLLEGTEYRTADRYLGKTVFKKIDRDTGKLVMRVDGESFWRNIDGTVFES